MEKKDKQFFYFSGPPCAGKSTICRKFKQKYINFEYIVGDHFWIPNDQYDFYDRVQKTNQDILSSIKNISSKTSILEWVPFNGPFIDDLKDICRTQNIKFHHIIVYAPIKILEQRKFERDGDKEISIQNIDEIEKFKNAIHFDTSKVSIDSIISACEELL